MLKKLFNTFLAESRRKGITMFVTGKPGVGKSRLVNALFGKPVAKESPLKKTCTASLTPYSADVGNGSTISIVDTPGLQDGKFNTDREWHLERLAQHVRQGLDLIIYCIKMDDRRFYEDDKAAMRSLTDKFGKDIWKNAVIALTFANKVEDPDGENEEDQKDYFKRDLKVWQDEIGEFLAELDLDSSLRSKIKVVPVGNNRKPELPTCENWLGELWVSCFDTMEPFPRVRLYGECSGELEFPGARELEGAGQNDPGKPSKNIPRTIPLSPHQQKRFWEKLWDSFKLYCTEVAKRPEVIIGLTSIALSLLFKVKLP